MSRNFHDDIRDPNLFTENAAGNYQYETRADGGKSAAGSLRLADSAVRDNQAQASVGGDARRGKDHDWGPDDGGHLIGARFGGSPGEENLTAQSRNLNRSDYKRMENQWAEHLDNGDKVFVFVETDGGERPTAYMGYVIYESPDGTRDWDVFSFTNESRSEQERWEEELDAYEAQHPEIYEEMGMHPREEEYLDYTDKNANDYLGDTAPKGAQQNAAPAQTAENAPNEYLGDTAGNGLESSGESASGGLESSGGDAGEDNDPGGADDGSDRDGGMD